MSTAASITATTAPAATPEPLHASERIDRPAPPVARRAALAATILQGTPREPLPAGIIWRRRIIALWAERRYQAALRRRDRNERRCRALARERSRARVALFGARGLL